MSVTPEPPLRMPRQEPFQRRWRPPPAVSDSPLRYGNRARAKRALSPEVCHCCRKSTELPFLQHACSMHLDSLPVEDSMGSLAIAHLATLTPTVRLLLLHRDLSMVQKEMATVMRLCDTCSGILLQAVPASVEDAQVERSGSGIDRWEPGSDFESTKPVQRAGRRKLNGAASSAPAGRPVTPVQAKPSAAAAPAAGSPVTQSVAGPGRSDRSLDRSEPASCLFRACLHVLQGGAALERWLAIGGRGLEASCLGQGSCSYFAERQALFRMERITEMPPVC